jgi:hypothetical protein
MTRLKPSTFLRRALRGGAFALALAAGTGALCSTPASAQTAGTFAQSGFGARGIGLGNALAADASGHASPYYNPALAVYLAGQNLEASAALLSLDREWQFLQISAPLPPRAGFAAGLIRAAVGGIDGRDQSGYHTREYSTDEMAFFLAFGTRIGSRASIGAGLQLFRANLFEEVSAATSIGLDIGLNVRPTDALSIGLVVDDLLARYAWDTTPVYERDGRTTSDRFPTRLRAGLAWAPPGEAYRLYAEYESRITSRDHRTRESGVVGAGPTEMSQVDRLRLHDALARVGGEYELAEAFTVRAGVDAIAVDGRDGLRPAAGFRLRQPVGNLVFEADYTGLLQPYGAGLMHMITARVFL